MTDNLTIKGVNLELDSKIKKYAFKKIGKLKKLIPRNAKQSAQAQIILSRHKGKPRILTCEVILELPHKTLVSKDSTTNIFSSIDLVEVKLARQIRRYKTKHHTARRRLAGFKDILRLGRFKRRR